MSRTHATAALGADIDAIELDEDTLDALAIAAAVNELRRLGLSRRGRSAGWLLQRLADRMQVQVTRPEST